ncbi:uncharacterized protein PITG_11176 [Phytophthora infestans T30-4]|uniref:DUF2423 domain-containing protein n=1 Tax=Phytophthora infestans (strain T30-4) TaxID=403677 RepID=D0NGC8_PHYIT|nr:uncharacterized protein PITG_11176 [Phytophthora infestans T30-4]EEY57329.1 conserved hypothetical protein [Phytophthora infestans T30-4]|eukprot:XP_002901939.1 conserved hypothetical protein [Phytophthora infestans T30-4]
MAKSLRSKIKRKFRTELRKRIGVRTGDSGGQDPGNLRRPLAAQGTGKSVASLKKLMGASVPVASSEITGVVKEQTPAEAEAALLNQEADANMEDVKKAKKDKKNNKKRKSKFVHFHQLRKKGV